MSRSGEMFTAIVCGIFGFLLVIGSLVSLWNGEIHLRYNYSAQLDQAWPIVLILFVLGAVMVGLSAAYLARETGG